VIPRGRWLILLLAATAWIVTAFVVLPRAIDRAYHGRGPAPLVRLLDRPGRKPLPHYQALGRDLAAAGLLALAAQATLMVLVPRLGLGPRATSWFLGASAAALALAALSGPRQDYVAYIEIWRHVRSGGDPWWIDPARGYPLNAYGPLFLALTPLSMIHALAPKLLMTAVALAGIAWFAGRITRGDRPIVRDARTTRSIADGIPTRSVGTRGFDVGAAVALALASVHVLIHTAWFGHFDVLAAAATVAAVVLARGDRDAAAGVSLGLGFLLKLLPAAILPYLFVDNQEVRRRVRWRFAFAAFATMALGMFVAWLIWGETCLRPFRFATVRGSQGLSMLRALRGFGLDLDVFSPPILLGSCGVVWLIVLARRLDATTAAACGLLVTLLAYKVGFAQYQTPLIALLLDQAITRGRWRAALLVYLGWVAGFDLFDWAVGGVVGGPTSRWAWVEAVAGVPTTALGLWLLASLLSDRPAPRRGPRPARG
jgi:hypothetical protein